MWFQHDFLVSYYMNRNFRYYGALLGPFFEVHRTPLKFENDKCDKLPRDQDPNGSRILFKEWRDRYEDEAFLIQLTVATTPNPKHLTLTTSYTRTASMIKISMIKININII